MTSHSFNVDDAVRHGTHKAVLLTNISFWLDKNRANGTNFHDGYWWTYNSAAAFYKLFPYMGSSGIIQRLLKDMEKDGLLLVGNYNKKGYDRTKWYSMPQYRAVTLDTSHSAEMMNGLVINDEWIKQKSTIHSPNIDNPFAKNEQPIPYINTDINAGINTDINIKKEKTIISDFFEPNAQQVAKINEFGINGFQLVESFISYNKTQGYTCFCWHEMFTVYLNNHITQYRLSMASSKPFVKAEPKQFNQQPDVYHPSQTEFKEPVTTSQPTADNWHWKDPLPGMSIPQTEDYIKTNKRKGENNNKAYQRFYAALQEQGL